MWPFGHLAVAYLLYSGYRRLGAGRLPAGAAVVLVALGSQFPDLVDKPMSWYLGALPTGRSLAHSLVLLVPLCGAVYALARQYEREDLAVAFAIGVLSHVVVDAVPAAWDSSQFAFLLWPVLPVEPYEFGPPTVLGLLMESIRDPYFHLEFVLLAVAVVVWRRDGYPGVGSARRFLRAVGQYSRRDVERQ